jgi:hypothetical protein
MRWCCVRLVIVGLLLRLGRGLRHAVSLANRLPDAFLDFTAWGKTRKKAIESAKTDKNSLFIGQASSICEST